jgi:hypothetical protein
MLCEGSGALGQEVHVLRVAFETTGTGNDDRRYDSGNLR